MYIDQTHEELYSVSREREINASNAANTQIWIL